MTIRKINIKLLCLKFGAAHAAPNTVNTENFARALI